MLRTPRPAADRTGVRVPLVQADATGLPFADEVFDIAFTAFGAIPFVDDSAAVMREVFRVLRPGGRWVFSVTHPMRWIFLDDPGEDGLIAVHSYFDRRPYVEYDDRATADLRRTAPHPRRPDPRTGGGRASCSPTWSSRSGRRARQVWGQWSPLRGRLFPGTAIFVSEKPRPAGRPDRPDRPRRRVIGHIDVRRPRGNDPTR